VSVFADRLRTATIEVSSPGGTIVLTATGGGDLAVDIDQNHLDQHSDASFGEELQGCIVAALRASRRTYVQIRREVFHTQDSATQDSAESEGEREAGGAGSGR
jgi:hypothetical protein